MIPHNQRCVCPRSILVLCLFLSLTVTELFGSAVLQQKIIDQFNKSATILNQQTYQDFEQIASQTTDDQALVAHRMSGYLEEALKLQSESKKSIIPSRLQGLFWYCYRAGQYDITSGIYKILTTRYPEQSLPADLSRAAADSSKRIASSKALIPQIAGAQKSGNLGLMRSLIEQAEQINPNSPEIMAWREKLFSSTATAQNILNEMQQAYNDQNYAVLPSLLEKMKAESTKTPGTDSFVTEAAGLIALSNKNLKSADSLVQKALEAQNKGFTIDAAQMASEALKLSKQNAQANDLLNQWGQQLRAFQEIEAQIKDCLNKNDYAGACSLYKELSTTPSSQSSEFIKKHKEYESISHEQIDQVKAIAILLDQGRFAEVLPGIKKWAPVVQKKEVGVTVGRELEKQKKYELAMKYYELSEDTYMINRARDLVAKESSKFDAKSLLDRYKKSILKISTVTNETTGAAKMGTGFMISANGYILTNWHVIDGGKKISVIIDKDQQQFKATLIPEGSSKEHDIALLKVDGLQGEPLRFGNSDAVEIGDKVFTIGNPLLTTNVITEGTLSSRQTGIEGFKNTLILVAGIPADHGNSGGPIFNEFGEVIGILMGGAEDTRISLGIDIRNISEKIAPYIRQ